MILSMSVKTQLKECSLKQNMVQSNYSLIANYYYYCSSNGTIFQELYCMLGICIHCLLFTILFSNLSYFNGYIII